MSLACKHMLIINKGGKVVKRLLVTFLAIALCIGLVGCVGSGLPEDKTPPTLGDDVQDAGEQPKEKEYADNLRINFAMGNNQRTITYQQATPLTMADGTVISQGALKPVWQYIQDRMDFTLEDVTIQDQKAAEMLDIAAATNFTNAVVYGGNSVAESLMNYGAQGYFLNLSKHMDQLPNFTKYLQENPDIKTAITAYDGNIYHIPYTAEIGNYARMYHGRESWVTSLLNSTDALKDENTTLNVQYEGYWDRHDENVISLQNEAANDGVLNRDAALSTLLTYIENTYPELEKPSDLYLGSTAVYDIDELIALFRVIKLSPNTLSAVTTGDIVPDAQISPYFVRQASYREDLFRLANYFGGQHVHGSDSYAARFYQDKDGNLNFSYAEDGFLEAIDYLEDMFKEGLIYSEFSDLTLKDNFRNTLYTLDNEEGHRQFGFMIYDWTASTTAANEDVVGMLPPVTTLPSIDELVHYVENTRVVKPDGWAISTQSNEEEINSALKLFDFFFAEEGHILQNYGTPSCIAEGEKFVAPTGEEYPKFSEWVLNTADELKSGDVSAFLRDFVGSLIPVGYQKEIGFELQYTTDNGWEAWDLYNEANVIMPSYDATNPELKLVPPVFSLTEQDLAKLNNVAIAEDQVDAMFSYITGTGNVGSVDQIKEMYTSGGVDTYIQVYRDAFARMSE